MRSFSRFSKFVIMKVTASSSSVFSKAFLRFSDKLADLKRRIEDRAVNQKVTQSISFMEKKCAFFSKQSFQRVGFLHEDWKN